MQTVVILLGWTGAQDKQLAKYSEIYTKKGCITLRCIIPAILPTLINILEPKPLTTDLTVNDDAETIGIVEHHPIFLKQTQLQHYRSHKHRKLKKEYKTQPVFQYAQAITLSSAPHYSVNRLGYYSDSADETALEDQQFSDYETTPRPPRRHRNRDSQNLHLPCELRNNLNDLI
ncbi:unnamed protein product [Allacma fusca]|uniref:Uncharacterized protein n=1 Tax=Allacma fusca TaxID=39272 RepID=A0A8J2PD82_9HEXA|nr:unnamed protein product [Allacma fusca]